MSKEEWMRYKQEAKQIKREIAALGLDKDPLSKAKTKDKDW
jgi:hypothetical protein